MFTEALGPVPRSEPVHQGSCHPPGPQRWGLAAPLYGCVSRRSWGIGDLGDLAHLLEWARRSDGLVMVNPLSAGSPVAPKTQSPYSPHSRSAIEPLHIDIGAIPGVDHDLPVIRMARDVARGSPDGGLIDRDLVWKGKAQALEALFDATHLATTRRIMDEDPWLKRWATYCAIAEVHGSDRRRWPEGLRSVASTQTREFAQRYGRRVAFHGWLQHICRQQMHAADTKQGLISDMAVGVDPGGADPWIWDGCFFSEATVGAPGDEFNPMGQDWGLTTFHPRALLERDGDAFIHAAGSSMDYSAGIRIDHVMGLFRVFWIPEGADPAEGTYIEYPSEHLLGWLSRLSTEHRCFVIGEDLGTVQDRVRDEMRRTGMLSYKLLLFEPDPSGYPELSAAAVTTHDLPTIVGLVDRSDAQAQERLGLPVDEASVEGLRDAVVEPSSGSDDPAVVIEAAYRLLASSPAALVLLTIEDGLGIAERPNMPGTTSEWPNFRRALPMGLEDALESGQIQKIVGALSAR